MRNAQGLIFYQPSLDISGADVPSGSSCGPRVLQARDSRLSGLIAFGVLICLIALTTACSSREAPLASAAQQPEGPQRDAVSQPADSGLAIKRGVLKLSDKGGAFTPCDSQSELLLIDQSDGALEQAFRGERSNGRVALYVEAYGELLPASEAPQASGYAGVFVLEQALYAGLQDEVRGCASPAPDYVVVAHGVEPFWSAKINEDGIEWLQPEAPAPIVLGAPDTEVVEGVVRYGASDGAHELEVLIDARACQDPMSGEYFAYSARAVLDGREFNGCARVGR